VWLLLTHLLTRLHDGTAHYISPFAGNHIVYKLGTVYWILLKALQQNETKGPSIKYVTLILANFDSSPVSHFVTHPGTPKSTSHISDPPPILVGLVQKPGQRPLVQILSQLLRGFCLGAFVRGSFVWKVLSGVVFVRTPFCQNTSVTTES